MSGMELYKADKTRTTWQLRFTDHQAKRRQFSTRTRDRGTALVIQHKIERLIDARTRGDVLQQDLVLWLDACHPVIRQRLQEWGIVEARAVSAGKPLDEHVEDWKQSILDNGRTERYADLSAMRVGKLLEAGHCELFSDIEAGDVQEILAGWRREGTSPRTSNHYLAKLKQFCRWMKLTKRVGRNPVEGMKGLDSRVLNTDVRRRRRPLELEEQERLLSVTAGEQKRWRMTGEERALLYYLALRTGLRVNELRTLTVASFALDAATPTVTVQAANSKHRKDDHLPLLRSLVPQLRRHLDGKHPGDPAWPKLDASNYCSMLRDDLQAAGIPYVDGSGRVADFHGLRHTFITQLARSGVHPRVAQLLARHSDINITMNYYTHVVVQDQAEALEALPELGRYRGAHRGAG